MRREATTDAMRDQLTVLRQHLDALECAVEADRPFGAMAVARRLGTEAEEMVLVAGAMWRAQLRTQRKAG